MGLKGVTMAVLELGILRRNKGFRAIIADISGAQLSLFKYYIREKDERFYNCKKKKKN